MIISVHKKSLPKQMEMERVLFFLVRLRGIEPPHTVPETIALSTELQVQLISEKYNSIREYNRQGTDLVYF